MKAAEQRLLAALASTPGAPRFGLDLALQAKVSRGSVYIHLSQLESDGLVESWWPDPEKPLKVYRLTSAGQKFVTS